MKNNRYASEGAISIYGKYFSITDTLLISKNTPRKRGDMGLIIKKE